jgi:hypothetical protein
VNRRERPRFAGREEPARVERGRRRQFAQAQRGAILGRCAAQPIGGIVDAGMGEFLIDRDDPVGAGFLVS